MFVESFDERIGSLSGSERLVCLEGKMRILGKVKSVGLNSGGWSFNWGVSEVNAVKLDGGVVRLWSKEDRRE